MRIRTGLDFQIQCSFYDKHQNPDCAVRIAVKRALYMFVRTLSSSSLHLFFIIVLYMTITSYLSDQTVFEQSSLPFDHEHSECGEDAVRCGLPTCTAIAWFLLGTIIIQQSSKFHLVIAAFAAINALGTPSQVLSPSGTTVMFSNISTVIGVMPANDAVFVCPSTAFYFVHYKLRAQRAEQVTTLSCIISLLAGSDEIQVSSFKSCFCRRYLKK